MVKKKLFVFYIDYVYFKKRRTIIMKKDIFLGVHESIIGQSTVTFTSTSIDYNAFVCIYYISIKENYNEFIYEFYTFLLFYALKNHLL